MYFKYKILFLGLVSQLILQFRWVDHISSKLQMLIVYTYFEHDWILNWIFFLIYSENLFELFQFIWILKSQWLHTFAYMICKMKNIFELFEYIYLNLKYFYWVEIYFMYKYIKLIPKNELKI